MAHVPYTPAHLVLQAVQAIDGVHALTAVTLPALLREAKKQGADPTTTQVPYGGGVEEQYLKDFYELAGAPDPQKPYRAISPPPALNSSSVGR